MYRRSVTACRGNPGAILLNSDSLILRKSAASFASMTSLPLASAYATRSIFSRIAVSSTLSRLVSWWPRTPFSLPSLGPLCRIS